MKTTIFALLALAGSAFSAPAADPRFVARLGGAIRGGLGEEKRQLPDPGLLEAFFGIPGILTGNEKRQLPDPGFLEAFFGIPGILTGNEEKRDPGFVSRLGGSFRQAQNWEEKRDLDEREARFVARLGGAARGVLRWEEEKRDLNEREAEARFVARLGGAARGGLGWE